jgi:hypothetical protein
MNDFFVGVAVLVVGGLFLLAIAMAVVFRLVRGDPQQRGWKALAKRRGWELCGEPRFKGKFGRTVWDMQVLEAADDRPGDEPCTTFDVYGLPQPSGRCAIMTEQVWIQVQDQIAARKGIAGYMLDELPAHFDFAATGCSVLPIGNARWPVSMVMVATEPAWARLWSREVARLWCDFPGVPAASIALVFMNGTMRLKVRGVALKSDNDLTRLWDIGAELFAAMNIQYVSEKKAADRAIETRSATSIARDPTTCQISLS